MVDTKKIGEKTNSSMAKVTKKGGKKTSKRSKKTLSIVQNERENFAVDVAEALGISSYEFLIIKRNFGIEDATSISAEEMKKYYKKIFN